MGGGAEADAQRGMMLRAAAVAAVAGAIIALPMPARAQPGGMPTATRVPATQAAAWDAIAAAENARASTPAQLTTLLDGTRSTNAVIRGVSVRALGRLERPDLTDSIARHLQDPVPSVRARAAAAIALANLGNRQTSKPRDHIENALVAERDPQVIAALAEAFGRFRNADAAGTRASAAVILQYADRGPAATLGVVRGLHFLARQPPALRQGLDTARTTLVRIASQSAARNSVHARRLAVETVALAGFGTDTLAAIVLKDPDPIVRRGAMLFAAQARDTAMARRIALRGLGDPHWMVQYDALRQLAARVGPATPCSFFMPYVRDRAASMHVRLQATTILGARCAPTSATVSLLDSLVRTLPAADVSGWHIPTHALVALASRDADRARASSARFASHPNLFVRTYAATAAATLRDTAMLERLAADPHPNVRTAAVQGLSRLVKHAADSVYMAQLASDDAQLLMAAAAALDTTTHAAAASAVLSALDRVSALRTENSRDGRLALLDILPRVATAAHASRVSPYLQDFDPAVADRAALVLKAWGVDATAAPRPLPAEPMPTYAELARIADTRLVVEMANGSRFEIQLLPFDAPANAARFARMARAGEFDGRTLHRVEPSFVVQGGSQSANEYAGAARFSRDEIGYPNIRGTVGLSTRGHDTGDGQIFINMIDNVQLDPLYTVFGVVVSGMATVDTMLEGAVIRRITSR